MEGRRRSFTDMSTPQFINYSSTRQSKKNILAMTATSSQKKIRESVTAHPFSNFSGDLAMCQIIFSGSGMTSHIICMCPAAAEEKKIFSSVSMKRDVPLGKLYWEYTRKT